MKKVVLAGGTGFIGQYFEKRFSELGYQVKIISRNPIHITWDNQEEIMEAIENAEMVVNLAGKSVNCRYNERNKREIYSSRTETTETLGKAMLSCQKPPSLWI